MTGRSWERAEMTGIRQHGDTPDLTCDGHSFEISYHATLGHKHFFNFYHATLGHKQDCHKLGLPYCNVVRVLPLGLAPAFSRDSLGSTTVHTE